MPGDDPHHNRVARATAKILKFIASLEDDKDIFPDGLPEDEDERTRVIGLLSADSFGGALALTYISYVDRHSEIHARQWLTQILAVFQPTVQRELNGHKIDWELIRSDADALWDFSEEVPDTLPEDF